MYKIMDTATGLFLNQDNKLTRKGRIYHDLGGVVLRLQSALVYNRTSEINKIIYKKLEHLPRKTWQEHRDWHQSYYDLLKSDPEVLALLALTGIDKIKRFIPDTWKVIKYINVIDTMESAQERLSNYD